MSRPATVAKILKVWAMVILLVGAPSVTRALEPDFPNGDSFIQRAIFAEGRLWILSASGHLSSIAPDDSAPRRENLPEPAYDLCALEHRPLVITGPREKCRAWMLREWRDGEWRVRGDVPTQGDDLSAVSCDNSRVTLLTDRRLIDVTNEAQRSVELKREPRSGLVAVTCDAGEQLYVGLDSGEWGGGMFMVNRNDGVVLEIKRNDTGELCGGPLDTGCDPVNAIVSEPGKADCVVAAICLQHLGMPNGRLVEVCGERVGQFYSKTRDIPMFGRLIPATVPFYGLVRQGSDLWAVSDDGLFHFESSRFVGTTPLPHFRKAGGIEVSFDLPHMVLLTTDLNGRVAVSPSVPMLISR